MKEGTIGYGCIVLSVAVHASAVLTASRQRPSTPPALHTELELAVPSPTPPPTPSEPLPPPPTEALPAPKPPSAPRVQPIHQTPPAPTASPTATTPELSGDTLLGQGDAEWSAPAGNGQERDGPIHAGPALLAAPAPALIRPGPAAPPAITTEPLAQLSRKPVPPALGATLERNYPSAARSQGKSGEAKVRALIDALGRVASVTVTSESAPEFGAACKKTLQQSQWTPPLGQLGKPTATFITYRCGFRIND